MILKHFLFVEKSLIFLEIQVDLRSDNDMSLGSREASKQTGRFFVCSDFRFHIKSTLLNKFIVVFRKVCRWLARRYTA